MILCKKLIVLLRILVTHSPIWASTQGHKHRPGKHTPHGRIGHRDQPMPHGRTARQALARTTSLTLDRRPDARHRRTAQHRASQRQALASDCSSARREAERTRATATATSILFTSSYQVSTLVFSRSAYLI
jgi:hypothetical protein